jgi:chromosome segregation ATPase
MKTGGGDTNTEVLRLRKELINARTENSDLKEELEEKEQAFLRAAEERDKYKDQIRNARDSINKIEEVVHRNVQKAVERERKELEKMRSNVETLNKTIEILKKESESKDSNIQ